MYKLPAILINKTKKISAYGFGRQTSKSPENTKNLFIKILSFIIALSVTYIL